MAFNYKKYNEIVENISYLSEKLKHQDSSNYKSFKVQDAACQLISYSNSLLIYIRHSDK